MFSVFTSVFTKPEFSALSIPQNLFGNKCAKFESFYVNRESYNIEIHKHFLCYLEKMRNGIQSVQKAKNCTVL